MSSAHEEMAIAASMPISKLMQFLDTNSTVIAGPFAHEFSDYCSDLGFHRPVAITSEALFLGLLDNSNTRSESRIWDSEFIIVTDPAFSHRLTQNRDLTLRTALTARRVLIFPSSVPLSTPVTAFPDAKSFSIASEDGDERWIWCISEDGTGDIILVSHCPRPFRARLKFSFVLQEQRAGSVRVDGIDLDPFANPHERDVEIQPGTNTFSFVAKLEGQPQRADDKPWHFAIYNLKLVTPSGEVPLLRPYRPIDSTTSHIKESTGDAMRHWLHLAGFPYIARAHGADGPLSLSRGTVMTPEPRNMDDRTLHQGEYAQADGWQWTYCMHRHRDAHMLETIYAG